MIFLKSTMGLFKSEFADAYVHTGVASKVLIFKVPFTITVADKNGCVSSTTYTQNRIDQ